MVVREDQKTPAKQAKVIIVQLPGGVEDVVRTGIGVSFPETLKQAVGTTARNPDLLEDTYGRK